MPVINVTLSPIPEEQKKELISRLVEVSMDITGTPEHGNAVIITELPLNALGVGKKTAAEVFGNK
ncbi:tautomerase family protein [Tepidibacter hydrothermalis]|uniref:Tautomerase family protein n=1 Tax=Tepidibacter hydrothermalis TaxID=3036126 RepID=A0ABY8EJ68_9FIRM|nr:tautomerase family protein [Tepidibacter hydrothermalis]WFD11809.1 tautomerase family protein [Tepidibacter hydrothermalis]